MDNRPVLWGAALLVGAVLLAALLAGVRVAASQGVSVARGHYVASQAGCGGVSPCYATIQAAVDAASPGDEVRVAAGVYTDVVTRVGMTQSVFLDKPLAVTGGYTTGNWLVANPDVHHTVIDARGLGRGLVISGTRGHTIIQGLRITAGDAGEAYLGGGVYAISATLVFSNNWVYTNTAGIGAGIHVDDCPNALLVHNRIYDNVALEEGGGIAVWSSAGARLQGNQVYSNTAQENGGGAALASDDMVVTENAFFQNRAGNDGGGLAIMGSMNVSVTNNQIYANRADGNGGGGAATAGIFVFAHNDISGNGATGLGGGLVVAGAFSSEVTGNRVYSNTANDCGGGLVLAASSGLTVEDNRVAANHAAMGGGLCFFGNQDSRLANNEVVENRASDEGGGGIYISDDNPQVEGNRVYSNTTDAAGGGLYLLDVGSGGVLSSNQMWGNSAGTEGGGIAAVAADALVLTANRVYGNYAGTGGGGLHLSNSADGVLINNVVSDNRVGDAADGAGLALDYTRRLRLLHNTLRSNRGGVGSALFVTDSRGNGNPPESSVSLINTILVSHTTGIRVTAGNQVDVDGILWYGTTVTMTQDATAIVTITRQIVGDPAFAPDGYHLTAASAARDGGVNAGVAYDIDGEARPQGAGYDLGADEYVRRLVYLPLVRR